MKTSIITASVVALLCAPLAPVAAQQAPKYLSVLTVETELGDAPSYEQAVTQLMKAMRQAKPSYSVFASQSLSRPGTFHYVSPLSSLGEMESRQVETQRLLAQNPGAAQKVGQFSVSATTEIIQPRPELSYQPSRPRLSEEEQPAPFARIMRIQAKRGRALELEAVFKEYAALNKKLGIRGGYQVYSNLTGVGPTYFVRSIAKTQVNLYANAQETDEKLGASGRALVAKTGPMIHQIEYSSGIPRPDLSLQP